MKAMVLLILCLLLIPAAADARTWLVRQDGSGDCTTIQGCCDSAVQYDTVSVSPGTYEEQVILEKALVVISAAGPSITTILAPPTTYPALRLNYPGTVVDGFSIRGVSDIPMVARSTTATVLAVSAPWGPAGVDVWGGTLRNCLIVKNHGDGLGSPADAGGVRVRGSAIIEGNTIVANGGYVTAGGIYCVSQFNGQIVRNIVAQNTEGYGVYCEAGASPTFICNNVWGNVDAEYGGACTDPTGTAGNISVDPLFCDSGHDDYALHANSPCLAAPGCGLMGALGEGCGTISVEEEATSWGRIKVLFR